jgi:hypothetical protein
MIDDNEHDIIRIPRDTRTKLRVEPSATIRLGGRPFKVAMAFETDLDLIKEQNIGEDECVFFSGEFGNETFRYLNLPDPDSLGDKGPNEVVIGTEPHNNRQLHLFTWCKSTQKQNEDEIYIPAAGRRLLGVDVNDKIYVGDRGKGLIVKQAYKADLNNYKDLSEDNIIFMSYKAPNVSPLDHKQTIDGFTIDQIVEQVEEVFGPDIIKVESKETDGGFAVNLEWDEIVMGGAEAPMLKDAFSGAFGQLQKQLNDLAKDAANVSEKINELNEAIDEN